MHYKIIYVNKMIKNICFVLMFVLCVDLLGAIAWELTSQTPPDQFHAGIITESIIRAIK